MPETAMDRVAPEQDVVVSSRVRLARNYADIPFSPVMDEAAAEEVIARVREGVAGAPDASAYRYARIRELSDFERKRLVERHLISYDLLKSADFAAAYISSGECVSIMMNEEDHLRLQGLLPGLQLERAAELSFQWDDALGAGGAFAFDPQWGYLTCCLANTGTGMRASTMLHLPALNATGQISAAAQTLSRLGLTMRGLYGEGGDAVGALYQLSNQVTLGRAEEDVLRTLSAATMQVAAHERAARARMVDEDLLALTDQVMRSIGQMRYARIMTSTEFMKRVSDLRFAAELGLFGMSLSDIDALTKRCQNASIAAGLGEGADERAVDEARANLLRDLLRERTAKSRV